MRVTIKDIARETNLSPATVSLVLNNKPHRLSEETRKRVFEAAERLNYRPNTLAASLITNSTKTIGIVAGDITNAYFAELISGAENKCREEGYGVLICTTNNRGKKDLECINLMIDRGVDGVVLSFSPSASDKEVQEVIDLNKKFNIQIAAIDYQREMDGVMHVRLDNWRGGYLAVKHLIHQGHTKIGCITGPIPSEACAANMRLLGYKQALAEAGIECRKEWIVYGDYYIENGYELAGRLAKQEVTAIFALNDLIAYGVYKWARENSIVIPDQLSVIGYDDIAYSDFFSPGLTTVRQPAYEMGYMAASKIIDALSKEKVPEQITVFQPELILRNSTRNIESR